MAGRTDHATAADSVLCLQILAGPEAGRSAPIDRARLVIGRERDCRIELTDPKVSRHHAAILWDGYSVRVRDLGSRNGTRLNGRPLRGEEPLSLSDRIALGDTVLEVTVGAVPLESETSASAAAGDRTDAGVPGRPAEILF